MPQAQFGQYGKSELGGVCSCGIPGILHSYGKVAGCSHTVFAAFLPAQQERCAGWNRTSRRRYSGLLKR